ncbi:NADPH:quinone oxidoreductase [Bacillus sp. FJAT-18017]|uniref:NAD(P)H-quinone oxidoreductase n=1 Tax=Bacillus sp. FJAT-18017 TaxID=1705566 RepID=UPI0006AFCEE0|nr:NAD(P)H-quinone oxidoreductase [Bacillus sp. FJAT-18017]ALC91584.1 NADPH:quinone oxidoreductase [Bacillus sp. FJAT-18017]
MKAIFVDDDTKQLYIDNSEEPVAGEDELLIRVNAAALNRADLLQKIGKYPPPPGESEIIGLEVSGVVEEAGKNVKEFQAGDRVCALLAGGGYAEKVKVSAGLCIPIPEKLDFIEAAAIPEAFLTAYLNLFDMAKMKEGDIVLIHAAASGVGTAAIQLAIAAGATPIATAGSEEKLEFCRTLGARHLINYKEEDFSERVEEITSGRGVDIILDPVGASYFQKNLSSIALDGRWVVIGGMGGYDVENVPLRSLMRKRASLIGSTLRSRSVADKSRLTRQFKEFALSRFSDGSLLPVVDKVFNWREANEAHQYMEQNKNKGKIVLKVD